MTAICLHCRRTITRRGTMLVGQNDTQRLGDLGLALTEHLQLVHPQQMQEVAKLTMEMSGLAVFSHFKSSDPYYIQERTNAAADVRRVVARVVLDEDLENLLAKSAAGREAIPHAEVLALFKQMRDYLNYADAPQGEPLPEMPDRGLLH